MRGRRLGLDMAFGPGLGCADRWRDRAGRGIAGVMVAGCAVAGPSSLLVSLAETGNPSLVA